MKKLKIGSVTYQIRHQKIKDPGSPMARCDFRSCQITINSEYNKQLILGSLLHEVFEAIREQYVIPVSHSILSVLAEEIAAVLRENKKLFQDLF